MVLPPALTFKALSCVYQSKHSLSGTTLHMWFLAMWRLFTSDAWTVAMATDLSITSSNDFVYLN